MRFYLAVALYPLVDGVLFGVGVLIAATLAPFGLAGPQSLFNAALAALVLAAPLAWQGAPLLLSARERRVLARDESERGH